MYGTSNGTSTAPGVPGRFGMAEIAGGWRSLERAPRVRILRNEGRRDGGYWVEFAYDEKTVLRRPIRRCWNVCYFELYGWITLCYDSAGDILTLSGYGKYRREEDAEGDGTARV